MEIVPRLEVIVDASPYDLASMTEPVRLPRAREATIPTAKLVSYALDPSHERGQHKARVFASALGIIARDWRYLHDQILVNLPRRCGPVNPHHAVRRRL